MMPAVRFRNCPVHQDELALADFPDVQSIGDRFGSMLTNGAPVVGLCIGHIAFDAAERAEVFQGFRSTIWG
ncbi:hypothetical protein [Burkholderia pyrrocinia]|uniref:Uncharacterized protein n=1 Tax=Burkholderia pyrrocinia TaxID=60550 RepID=A0ABZ3BN58_BURPY